MSNRKWLIATLSLTLFFGVIIVAVNFYIDHYGVRLILFNGHKEIRQNIYPIGLNQHMFNPEYIFRNPEKFDSFLFGSSRTMVIQVDKISSGRFYNMSYSLGLLNQHLAIIRALTKKGVKINTVLIGLDDICFSQPAVARQKHLIRIMHPDICGPNRANIFDTYFFRKPNLKELSLWRDRVLRGRMKGVLTLDHQGVHMIWHEADDTIEKTGKPIFHFTFSKYEPAIYGQKEMDEAFASIEELIALSKLQHFKLIFFIIPFYAEQYLNQAKPLWTVKERLANITEYYDFSGINSVTINSLNYFDAESHYRYRVGDMIISRIFGGNAAYPPNDFGVLVTKESVSLHLEKQKSEFQQYLRTHKLQ